MDHPQIFISTPSQLNSLSRLRINKVSKETIIFDSSFQHPEREKLQRELNTHFNVCGCGAGAKAFLFGVAFFGAVTGCLYIANILHLKTSLILFIAGAISFSGIGKFYAIYKAHSKLKRIIIKIQDVWTAI